MPKLFDTHTHLNFKAFKDDRDEVVRRTLDQECWITNIGTKFETSREAMELAESYSDGVYAAIGLHPIHIHESHFDEEESSFQTAGEKFDARIYEDLAVRSTKVVAIGECGLDYYHIPEHLDENQVKKEQAEVFRGHLKLATKLGKPVMVHCRNKSVEAPAREDAYQDLMLVLKECFSGKVCIHSFTGSWEQAKGFIELGYYVGFNGIITFDKTGRSDEVVKNIPLEQVLLETDAPYLAPKQYRGKRNEPLYIEFVGEKIAEIKGIDKGEVMRITTENAIRFYNLI